MAVRWVLRDRRRHSKRLVLLVDAQAVLGAAARGRSSAQSIKRTIRRYGALVLGGDLLARLVYIPSEDNPADAPSRNKKGVIRGSVCAKSDQRTARLARQARAEHRRIRTCPGCGVAVDDHPLHLPKSQRGGAAFCRPAGISYCWRNERWISEVEHRIDCLNGLGVDDSLRVSWEAATSDDQH